MKKKKLLIVDDEPDLLDIFSEILESENFDVTKANCGEEAIVKIKNEKFDFIISDHNMGEVSGKDLLNFVNDSKINTPFILVSGESLEGLSFYNSNGEVLNKPLDIDSLIEKINKSF